MTDVLFLSTVLSSHLLFTLSLSGCNNKKIALLVEAMVGLLVIDMRGFCNCRAFEIMYMGPFIGCRSNVSVSEAIAVAVALTVPAAKLSSSEGEQLLNDCLH